MILELWHHNPYATPATQHTPKQKENKATQCCGRGGAYMQENATQSKEQTTLLLGLPPLSTASGDAPKN
jgi:hypothetical protein